MVSVKSKGPLSFDCTDKKLALRGHFTLPMTLDNLKHTEPARNRGLFRAELFWQETQAHARAGGIGPAATVVRFRIGPVVFYGRYCWEL